MDARNKLFEQYTAPLNKNFNSYLMLVSLAKQFDGYSASDIKDVCQGAQIASCKRNYSDSANYHEPVDGEPPIKILVSLTAWLISRDIKVKKKAKCFYRK